MADLQRAGAFDAQVQAALEAGRRGLAANDPTLAEMRANRRVAAQRLRGGASMNFATGRTRDPMWYWRENNSSFDVTKPEHLIKLREYCRAVYMTHPVAASAIDIYSKYPLLGMELTCKDPALTEFYTDLFLDQLDYEEFLIDVGREHWTVGEAWPFGSFNETLGVWEDDELLNPDDVRPIRSPFMKELRFEMRLPEMLREIIEKREPKWEYDQLIRAYPELRNFMGHDDWMPVSNILLQFLKFKGHTFHSRGIPILLRAVRSLVQEEMMNAGMDSVASRLITPLLLVKLGASASDLGTQAPWVPTEQDRVDFEDALDAALSGDFRMLVHHFAIDISNPLGREMVPDLSMDFDRLTERILQVFGLSKTMLSGASSGETYAADALNRDLISQLMTTYQRKVRRLYEQRARVVAEAQGHYDYEMKGAQKVPVMEEVLVRDENGNDRIVQQPKLLIPDLKLRTMSMKDETSERQFVEALRESGIPISQRTRMINVPIDLDEEYEKVAEEQIEQAVRAAEVNKETYKRLQAAGLPIPPELAEQFQARPMQAQQDAQAALPAPQAAPRAPGADQIIPTLGIDQPDHTALAPERAQTAADPALSNGFQGPRNDVGHRPPESDEQRRGMPRAASPRTMRIEF